MLNTLTNEWQGLTNDQLYQMWKPLGLVTGVTSKSGLMNEEPLHDWLDKYFEKMGSTFKRKLVVSSVDANSGNYIQWDENSPDPMKSVISSAAIPFVFNDQIWDDGQTVAIDGGSVYNTNLVSAVQKCRDQVEDDSQITLDVLVLFAHNIEDSYQ